MAGEDKKYIAWIRRQRCRKCGYGNAYDVASSTMICHAHHMTGGGMGAKSHDHDAMPLCYVCHANLHELSGGFTGWTKKQLRNWQQDQVDYCRKAYLAGLSGGVAF